MASINAILTRYQSDPMDFRCFTASSIPIHCHDALGGINDELTKFFASLDELKLKILPNELQLTEEEPEETLLNQWQRTHSPRTKKLTGYDREMAFLVGFRELVALLKSAQAAELVYRIQSFVKRAELWELPQMLRAIATRDRPGGKVQDFVKKLVEQIKHRDEDTEIQQRFLHVRDPYGVDLLHEVLEAFLMEKLHAKTLTPSREVASQDEAFRDRHLDLPVPKTKEQEQAWLRIAKQLEAMTLCPSPRRKMDAVMRVCQDLTTFLKAQNGGKFPSADEFLPALIYVVLRANPCYFFTHLVSSVAFLEEVNGSSLTIAPEEFDEELRRSKEVSESEASTVKLTMKDDQPKRPDKKRVMLRFGGGRRSFSSRRHQFTLWKGQAASNVVKTLRGCYALARQELTAWRSRSKTASAEEPASETKASPRHRVFNLPKSPDLKRPRNNSRTSAASSTSIVSSLSSTTEAEEEQHKELYRSELSFCVRRSSSLEMKPSLSGFAETTSGSHERLLLVNTLPLNDEDDEDNSLTSRHLPFRSTRIDGRMRVLHNEWV
ncbi:VPS9 domain [Phytophthora cactorum]|nr:VPS9 domain [Phytophthora cactorum]